MGFAVGFVNFSRLDKIVPCVFLCVTEIKGKVV